VNITSSSGLGIR